MSQAPPPRRLSRRFFARSTLEVAQDLVGRSVYRRDGSGLVGGRLVEVEAYCGASDPASHAYRRMTPRNSVMFGPPGHLYVYFTYGMHHCANIVTEREGIAGAVLLRAVEPVAGLELMAERRKMSDDKLLARGPGRLCQAFGLTLADNGMDIDAGEFWVAASRRLKGQIKTSPRIGIPPGRLEPWRFFEEGPWASKPPRNFSARPLPS